MKLLFRITLVTLAQLLCITGANSQVICTYTNAVNGGNATLDIDANNDANADFRIASAQVSTLGFVIVQAGQIGTTNFVLTTGSGSASCLPLNAVIGPTATTWTQMNGTNLQMVLAQNTTVTGTWAGAIDQYLGLAFAVGTNTYYGWAKFSFSSSSNTYTFSGYAYQSTPGQHILAGQGCGSITSPVFLLPPSACAGGTVSLSAGTGSVSAQNYSWTASASGVSFSSPGSSVTTVSLSTAGNYTIALTTTSGTLSGNVNHTIAVNAAPVLTITPASQSVCSTQSIIITVAGATAYSWQPAGSTGSVLQISAPPPGQYAYSVTGQINGCSGSATVAVHVDQLPNMITMLTSPSMCARGFNGSPNSVTLQISGVNTSTLMTPSQLASQNTQSTLVAISMVTPFAPTGAVTSTVVGINGACTVTSGVTILVQANPTLALSTPFSSVCTSGIFTIHPTGGSAFTWSTTMGAGTFTSGAGPLVFTLTSSATFSAYTSSNGCQSETSGLAFDVFPKPVVAAQGAVRCAGETVTVSATGNGNSYLWMGPQGFSVAASTFSMNGFGAGTTVYTVTAIHANSCVNSATVSVVTSVCNSANLEYLAAARFHIWSGSGMLEITLDDGMIDDLILFDLTGKVVENFRLLGRQKVTLDIHEHSGDLLIVYVKGRGRERFAGKVIIN